MTDDDGRLFTLYERAPSGTEWEFLDGPHHAVVGVQLPDVSTLVACPFDCRWDDLTHRVAVMAASLVSSAVWVMDDDGLFFDASRPGG